MADLRTLHVYADGGVILKNPSEIGGTWAFCLVDTTGERFREHAGLVLPSYWTPAQPITNNVTELYALVRATFNTPTDCEATFYSDSLVTLRRLFHNGTLNGVPDALAEATGKARARLRHFAAARYVLLDGHPTRAQLTAGTGKRGNPVSIHNVWCDTACTQEARKHLAALKGAERG